MKRKLQGILPVIPTPFCGDGAADAAAMGALAEFALSAGAGGVVYPGFASEVEHLTADERQVLLARLTAAVAGRAPVVAGASAQTAQEVIRHGAAASALGIDWLMVQPPVSVGAQAAGLIRFFREICAQLPAARIILQNAPLPRGADIAPEIILEVAAEVSQIAYVKEETLPAGPAITRILAGRPDSLMGVIGGGGARYVLDEFERGACAAMPAIEIADLHVEMDRAWREGDKARARRLYVETLPLLTLQAVYRMRLTKHVLVRRGILANAIVRAPVAEPDALAIADIDRNLAELGLVPADALPKRSTA